MRGAHLLVIHALYVNTVDRPGRESCVNDTIEQLSIRELESFSLVVSLAQCQILIRLFF